MMFVVFFFVKQKTAYEMLISDWSSDVCSSDLVHQRSPRKMRAASVNAASTRKAEGGRSSSIHAAGEDASPPPTAASTITRASASPSAPLPTTPRQIRARGRRSEEYPYELQSLMRKSYDVFCLKKKKTTTKTKHQ